MREHKGQSLVAFPDDYTVVDIETTGLSPNYDEIIEICAIKYRNGKLAEKYSTLVKPNSEVSEFIEQLTGINNTMLSTAPVAADVLPAFYNFINDDIIVGHNINFDINFLYDYCDRYLSKPLYNNYIDTMRIARLLHRENKHNRLIDLCSQYNLSYEGAHRAEYDCTITNSLFNIFKNEFISQYDSTDFKLSHNSKHIKIKAADITANVSDIPIDSALYDKVVVFTGTLEKMPRKDAMQIVANMGGINGDNVTKNTNFLVLGNNDYCASIKGGKSSKQKKAESYKLKGYDIEIIPENVFYDMVNIPSNSTNSAPVKETNLYPDLSDMENQIINIVRKFLSDSPYIEKFNVEQRSDSYVTLLCEQNDFMRFKYSPRAFWVSLRLPVAVAKENINSPLFAAQQNKRQLHWKTSITSIDEIENIKDFIKLSFVTNE